MPRVNAFPRRPEISTAQRARLLAFENDEEIVIVSAAITPIVVARVAGSEPVDICDGMPVFWLPRQERIEVVGSECWDSALAQIGHSLLAVRFEHWCPNEVRCALARHFPNIERVEPLTSEDPAIKP